MTAYLIIGIWSLLIVVLLVGMIIAAGRGDRNRPCSQTLPGPNRDPVPHASCDGDGSVVSNRKTVNRRAVCSRIQRDNHRH